MIKNKVLIFAMLIVAIVAVGSVSAADDVAIDIDEPADDIAIDEIAIEDDSADDVDESASDVEEDDITADVNEESRTVPAISYTTYQIDNTTNFTYVNEKISDGNFTGYEFVFDNRFNYTDFAMVTGNNNKFTGNGVTLFGSNDNLFTVAGSNNIIITGFNMQVATGKAAIYGANVFNADITNNNITGGKDGINIMQTYDNVTISGNTITGVTRDAISLVDHRTLSDSEWANRGCSIISNNVITGPSEYGAFIGGNFKGVICNNVISDVDYGFEFAGKKAVTNGRLCVLFNNNNISNVGNGINMYHPNVLCFNLTNSNIHADDYAIYTNDNFASTYVGVYNSNFTGTVSSAFKTAAGNNTANNTGF